MNFGLAPYFKDLLLKKIKASDCFGVPFDESINKSMQQEQIDVQIRYLNETAKQVGTQFFEFQFPRRPYAKNLFDCLITLLEDLPSESFLQLSVDGPNTNWSVLTMLHDDRCEKDYPKVIDISSCSLHVLHSAFKSGVKAKICKIFDDSLARRDTYIKICDADEFPLMY